MRAWPKALVQATVAGLRAGESYQTEDTDNAGNCTWR